MAIKDRISWILPTAACAVVALAALVSPAASGDALAQPGRHAGVGAAATARHTAPYITKFPALTTPWTARAMRGVPLPEYPRPQLERSRWLNLNGRWQYEQGAAGQPPPANRTLPETILVPFAVQSPLSGIERGDTAGWYRRTFTVPASWRGSRVLINFGAVSWSTRVYVNGRLAGTHRGDYTSFSLDITALVHRRRPNELIVGFVNPMGAAGEPVGKQVAGAPSGIWHTANSGIWQTVWLEPVAREHIEALDLTPDLRHRRLIVSATVGGADRGARLSAAASSGARTVATAAGPVGRPLLIDIPHPRIWSPSHPFLYALRVSLASSGHVSDTVRSYFAMRSISLGRIGGATRLLLNHRFVFETGALDQGYWPDGLYAPPADAAMRFDILSAKRLGYNVLREHGKVQPDRWYYWADKLGLLVWQDMPNMAVADHAAPTAASRAEFRRELEAVIVELRSHPSIVMWIPFNEGWGQFGEGAITDQIRRLDPSRPVDTDSGSANCCSARAVPDSDVVDAHLYTGPFASPGGRRASVIGEYGGILPYPAAGHRWPGTLESIGSPVLPWAVEPVTALLRRQYADMTEEVRSEGLSGAVFTELSGYEQELGILTYDRRSLTIPAAALHELNASLIASSRNVGRQHAPEPAVPPDTTGLWTFDEGTGTVAGDSSGFGHPLTLTGGAGWTQGVQGSALSITAPGQSAMAAGPVIDTSRSFTVSAWLRPSRAYESAAAVSEPGPDGSSFSLGIATRELGRQTLGGRAGVSPSAFRGLGTWWTFMVPAAGSCQPQDCGVRANIRYSDGRLNARTSGWHQVTGVYDAPSATISIYVDGEPEDVEHVDAVPAAKGPLIIGTGAGDYPGANTFLGAIDDVRTYARTLGPDEVRQLYRAQPADAPGPRPSPSERPGAVAALERAA